MTVYFLHLCNNNKTINIAFSEFDKIMEGKPLYVTTLRDPPDHLRSMFSYFDLAHKLGLCLYYNIVYFNLNMILIKRNADNTKRPQ